MSSPLDRSAVEIAQALRSRALSAVELMQACLDRVARRNPSLNAIVTLDAERALDRPRAADAALSRGGAAAAARMVPFDVGSDMSGSIRIPAHFCGVVGFKPTSDRVPGTGHIPPPLGAPRLDRLSRVTN